MAVAVQQPLRLAGGATLMTMSTPGSSPGGGVPTRRSTPQIAHVLRMLSGPCHGHVQPHRPGLLATSRTDNTRGVASAAPDHFAVDDRLGVPCLKRDYHA